MRVEVLRAWPRGFEQTTLMLPEGATVAAALAACGLDLDAISGYAVFGERVTAATVLRDGDRLELLRPLLVDPKEARRRRAAKH
ncbi:MAG: RnfH family protein [Gammaproteobacteria bacterium]|nr:RnfH family protein [Gammaproteobacteria bacterium]